MADAVSPYCLIAPVWGARHVRRWLDLALTSWLAAGNLPDLARRRPVWIQIMTQASDAAVITASGSYAEITRHAAVDLVEIDDLMAHAAMPVTLTLAYQRGIRAAAARYGSATVILQNADFILADGSLGAVADALDSGETCVLAPSLRGNEEEVGPALAAARDERGALTMKPRDLVAMAFAATHPTVLFSRMDQHTVHSTNPNQLFWRADDATLVGRPFCLFPLAFVAQDPVGPAEAFCDYGLAPLLTPDARPHLLNDSDAYFALELAPLAQEQGFLALGPPSLTDMAARLTGWTMGFHRDQVSTPVFYRAGDPGPNVAAVVEQSGAYVDALLSQLGPPQAVREHHYWRGGVALWRMMRRDRGVNADPPELGPISSPRAAAVEPSENALRRLPRLLLVGRPGRIGLAHPRHRLSRALTERIEDCRRRGEPVGFVGERTLAAFVPRAELTVDAERLAVVVALDFDYPANLEPVMAWAREVAPAAASMTLLCLSSLGQPIETPALARLFSQVEPWLEVQRLTTFDLRVDDTVHCIHGRLADDFNAVGWPNRLAMMAASAGAFAVMLAVNLGRRAWPRRTPSPVISAALIDAVVRA